MSYVPAYPIRFEPNRPELIRRDFLARIEQVVLDILVDEVPELEIPALEVERRSFPRWAFHFLLPCGWISVACGRILAVGDSPCGRIARGLGLFVSWRFSQLSRSQTASGQCQYRRHPRDDGDPPVSHFPRLPSFGGSSSVGSDTGRCHRGHPVRGGTLELSAWSVSRYLNFLDFPG